MIEKYYNRNKSEDKFYLRNRQRTNRKPNDNAKQKPAIRIIPLGGIGEIGKNMTVIEYGNDMVVIDCGLMFPENDMLGIDYVIPETEYLLKNKDRLRAIILTHGHEDHIGATPYVLPKFSVPVYGTKLTLALVEIKLAEHGVKNQKLKCVEPGSRVKCGAFEIEFVKVSHSIDDAVALAIHTPEGTLVHTGDFKIDFTPIDGKVADIQRFTELGKEGVLALMSDSTNAETPGYTISERSVGKSFEKYFSEAKGRIIIATFASNVHRLQQVIDVAKKYNRKVCLTGRSILRITGVAKELGYLNIPEKMIIEMDEIDRVRDSKVVILATGSQGEPMSGLVRMAEGEHSKINIKQGDLVILSSSSIPGNEKNISHVINLLYRQGARVVFGGMAQVHVSGHACQEELKLMLSMIKPQYFIPVHGEERHLYSHADLAYNMGYKKKNVFIPQLGMPIELRKKSAKYGEAVESGIVMIDGLGVGDVGSIVLKDRQVLSQDGLFVVVLTMSKGQRGLISEPEILSRGFVYVKEAEELMAHAKKLIVRTVDECTRVRGANWATIKSKVKSTLSSYLYNKTKRSPMILPIIIEV
jgi:ribonuclease J